VAAAYSGGGWITESEFRRSRHDEQEIFRAARAYDTANNLTTNTRILQVRFNGAIASFIRPSLQFENSSLTSISGASADVSAGRERCFGLANTQIAIIPLNGDYGNQYFPGYEGLP